MIELGQPDCWNGALTWWSCCPWGGRATRITGNAMCWGGDFSFGYCCGNTPPSVFSVVRAELRKRRGDPLDCLGETFEAWDFYFRLVSAFGKALRTTDNIATKQWRERIPRLVESTEFLINTYRELLWHPLTKRHLLSAPLAALEEKYDRGIDDHGFETLAIAGFCYYGFFTAVLVKLLYTWPLERKDMPKSTKRTHHGGSELDSTLQALRSWVPVADLLDFWGESRWAEPFGRGDLLLEFLREGKQTVLTPHKDHAWFPTLTRYVSNHSSMSSDSSSSLKATAQIFNKSSVELVQMPAAPSHQDVELAFSTFITEHYNFLSLFPPTRTSSSSSNESVHDLPFGWRRALPTYAKFQSESFKLPKPKSKAYIATVWSNHFGDALEVFGLLSLGLSFHAQEGIQLHFAGLEHPGGRAGEQFRRKVCNTLGRCHRVPIMSSLYSHVGLFSSSLRDSASETAIIGEDIFRDAQKYYSYEYSALLAQVVSEPLLGPGSDIVLCSTPFIACALLAGIMQAGTNYQTMLVHLHFPPLFNILHPDPILRVLEHMLLQPTNPQVSLHTSVLCGASLDCAQMTCLLGTDVAKHLLFVPPVAAYVDLRSAYPKLSDTALVWRIHHFLGDWAWDLVSVWPALLQKHLPWERSKAVKLQFYGVDNGHVRTQAYYSWAEIVDFLSVVLLPWDFTLKVFDEIFALQVPLMVPGSYFAASLATHMILYKSENSFWYHGRRHSWGNKASQMAMRSCNSHRDIDEHRRGALLFDNIDFKLQDFLEVWQLSDFSLRPCVFAFDGLANLAVGLVSLTDSSSHRRVRKCMRLQRLGDIREATQVMRLALSRIWHNG